MELINIHTVNSERGHTDAQLIDVREPHEVAEGMIEEAINIPLGDILNRIGEIDKARPIWAICRSGNRSGQAATILSENGFNVFNMEGGMLAWNAAGYETR